MRYLSILLIVLLTTCSTKVNNENVNKQLVNSAALGQELIDIGFLRFADSTALHNLKSEIINSFYIYNEANYKIAHVDAEELAEFNFNFFVPTLKKILEKRNFKLDVQTSNDYEQTNNILINGRKIRLYSKEEIENGLFWESAPKNFFREINSQLKKSEIVESFYLIYSGNDLEAILLTENEHRIIAFNNKYSPKEIPYLP